MLAIRLQRTGRSGHAQFRLIVQDSRFSPTSGRVVAFLGSYNPHTKEAILDKDKASEYLVNGAQPSDRAAKLLKKEGVKLPSWVEIAPPKKRAIRNPDKLRRNRPAGAPAPGPKAEESVAETVEPAAADATTTETPSSEATETPDEETKDEPKPPAGGKAAKPETENAKESEVAVEEPSLADVEPAATEKTTEPQPEKS